MGLRRPGRREWLAAIREENDYLQRFTEQHEQDLPPGMVRLVVNLGYAVKTGKLREGRDDLLEGTWRSPRRRAGGRVYRTQ